MNQQILGIDISKDSFDVALLDGGHIYQGKFSSDQTGLKKLAKWLKKRRVQQVHACMEATSRYWEDVAYTLYEQGYKVSMVNPKLIKKHAQATMQRNKTDKQDAVTIVDYCAKQEPDLWTPPPPTVRQLQVLVRHVEALKQDRQRERNRRDTSSQADAVVKAIDRHVAFLDKQIADLEEEISDLIDKNPDLKQQYELLRTIPGVGDKVATTFLAEVPNVNWFAQASQLAAFAGLTPGEQQSGTSLRRKGKLVKWGNAHLRSVFYMPALSAHRWNPVIAGLRKRMQAKKKHNLTIIVATMRKMLHLCYGVLKTGKPFDPNHAIIDQISFDS
ncbi:MAG: transposase [Candidatus Promineifilaceae bacterium]|nr:transposase [Candidatus Promineifilaceae bacterium]